MNKKYEKIDIDDAFPGDIIYFDQRQEGNDEPHKYRPFLVMDTDEANDTIDLVPITHSGPETKDHYDIMSAYNVEVVGKLQTLLQERSHDERPSFLNVAQREIVDRSEFNDLCNLQLMISGDDYKFRDWQANKKNIADMKNVIDDAYPKQISKFVLSQMHIAEKIDPNVVEEYPLNGHPVDRDFLDKCDQQEQHLEEQKHKRPQKPMKTNDVDLDF